MGKAILGFPCRFDDNEGRKTIRWVLKRIRERSPRDLQRLRRQVLGFRWLSRENIDNGYGGCFESEGAMRLSPGVKVGAQTLYPPGWVQILRGLKGEYLSAVIAHELGHAATTVRNFDKRRTSGVGHNYLAEACANYYAYKWGFGKQMRMHHRDKHQNIQDTPSSMFPGKIITATVNEDLGTYRRFRITRNFYLQEIELTGI